MITRKVRQKVAERAGWVCEYCRAQERFSPDTFSVDHIIPAFHQGNDNLDNLAYSCQGCNSFKHNHIGAIDPGSGKSVPLFNPRKEPWAFHFTWAEDFSTIIGLTPEGRATVERLKLNREGLVNLRAILRKAGKHPPG